MVRIKHEPWMDMLALDRCKRVGNEIHFDAKTKDEAQSIIDKAGRNSELGFSINTKAVEGDALAALKSAFPNVKYESGKVFKVIAANTALDRDVERFSPDVLNLFAQQINRKSITVLWQHDRETHGLGRMFGGTVTPSNDGGFDFVAHILVSNEARVPEQGERKLVDAVENEYVTDVSIGFRAYGQYKEEKINGENRYVYTYMIDPERPETKDAYIREISFVDFGAQVGATVIKSAKDVEFIEDKSVNKMTKSFDIEVGGQKFPIQINVEGDAITVKGEAELTAAIKAATDEATTKAAEMQKAIDDLKAPLVADVVNAKVAGLDEATVKAFTPEKLMEVAKEVTKASKGSEPDNTVSSFKNVNY